MVTTPRETQASACKGRRPCLWTMLKWKYLWGVGWCSPIAIEIAAAVLSAGGCRRYFAISPRPSIISRERFV